MAKIMGLEDLPLEVHEVIATYLSAVDLAHCLSVSRTWNNCFSNDRFWKRHCTTDLRDYFSKSKCLVEPAFKPPTETLSPIQENRLQVLKEHHLWQNWDSGRYKKEELEFDFDDSISYNIKVSFLNNDHLCIHFTFETQVWCVAETPRLVQTIPYCLNELWEKNVYKVVENNVIVIQCNLVQVYGINLEEKSWRLSNVFYFNKPEESSLSGRVDFNLQHVDVEADFERVICGQYLVGAFMDEEFPPIHVWNIKTGKKIKEDRCDICKSSFSIELRAPREVTNKVLVTFTFKNNPGRRCSIVYDLTQLQFVMPTRQDHSSNVLYFDGYLSVVNENPIRILYHRNNGSTKNETKIESSSQCLPDFIKTVTSARPLGSNILISTRAEVFLVNTSEIKSQNVETISTMKLDFRLSQMEVLFNRYILLHEIDYQSIKEIWKVGKVYRKVAEFPEDSGTFVASNSACTKIVLERGNKLIVLNFW